MGTRDKTNWAELQRLMAAQKSGASRAINADEMAGALKNRVKGQDHVVDDLVRLIKLQWAKEKRKRPLANLLFLGPPGTGKTELAKALAEYLYNDEKNMILFNCSELSNAETGKARLVGHPKGYVGADKGGELTRPMLNNPKQIVVFDEIEKGAPAVMDLFLQMMGEGRLTEQANGKVADFTQSIIILTSNAEHEAVGKLQEDMSDPHERANAIKGHLTSGGFFRPELMSRMDKIYVFKPLSDEMMAEVIILKMEICAKEFGLELVMVDPRLVLRALEAGNKLKAYGVRELDREVNNMLGDHFVAAKDAGAKHVRVDVDDDGEMSITAVSEDELPAPDREMEA